jgi:hypothetical protein
LLYRCVHQCQTRTLTLNYFVNLSFAHPHSLTAEVISLCPLLPCLLFGLSAR